ncbi:MAG: hypothetical protein K8R99_10375 [Actinomycetia bacterium]|nr:hypothetical protein [Actinomycetes bacterium]
MIAGRDLVRRVPDNPLTPAFVALLLAALFVVVRLLSVGDGNFGSFVGAGDLLSSGTSLPLQPGAGYDGQFYYRMAIEPLNFDATAVGVTIDSEQRLQRIGYPAMAWLVSLGGLLSVTFSLVAVNVLGLALIAGLGGVFAQRLRRHALWGLALALYYGLAFTLSKDLTEIVEVSFLLLGLLAARQQRYVLAALALSGAVLTRESSMFFVPAVAAWRLYTIVRKRQRPSAIDLTWVVPPLAFGLWQLVVRSGTGRWPITVERRNTVNFPGMPIVRALPELFGSLSVRSVVHLAEAVVLVSIIVFGLISVRKSRAEPLEIAVFIGLAIACLSVDVREKVWTIRSLRMFTDAYVMAMVVLLATSRRLTYVVAAVGAVSVTTYGYFIFNL